jgi:hypothetical protein
LTLFSVASGTFGPGTHTLTAVLPNCYYQIDLITGAPTPDGQGYAGRLISSDHGGTQAPANKPIAKGDFASATFWSTAAGQSIINACNGSSTSTSLAQYLVTLMPNLYGKNTGSHSFVNSNNTYFTNAQVALAIAQGKFTGNDLTTLSVALSSYVTSINLAGSAAALKAAQAGLKTSGPGSGMDTENVGTNGSAFGVQDGTNWTVIQLLTYVNAKTSPGSSVSNGAGMVFTNVIAAAH